MGGKEEAREGGWCKGGREGEREGGTGREEGREEGREGGREGRREGGMGEGGGKEGGPIMCKHVAGKIVKQYYSIQCHLSVSISG